MSVRMSERDLAALRAGIIDQVERDTRQQVWREHFDREQAKRHVDRAQVITAEYLRAGDVICSTHGYRSFQEEDVVQEIRQDHDGRPVAGDLWVVGRHGGSALRNDDPVLIEVRDGVDKARGSIEKLVHEYVERLAGLRQRAGDKQRDTYVVALGQLRAVGLINESTWREALDRPRIEGRVL